MNTKKSAKKRGRKALPLSSIILITLIFLIPTHPATSAPTLNLTVATNKQEYGFGENVYVNGNLTLNGSPVADALVAVEVRDSADLPFVFRTRPTGPIATDDWLVNFTALFPSDSNGNPKYSFKKGDALWIFVTIRNFDTTSEHYVIICIVLYDGNSVPIGAWFPSFGNIQANSSKTIFFRAFGKIPTSASTGTAIIYANAYSNLPKDGGFPYCPEKTATFTITSSTTASSTLTNEPVYVLSSDGSYNLSFKIPSHEARTGNYTVYVSSYYQEQPAVNTVIFKIILIGDINDDGVVDIFDAILLSVAFGSTPGQPNWNSGADLNGDNIVDIFDAIIFSVHFGEEAA